MRFQAVSKGMRLVEGIHNLMYILHSIHIRVFLSTGLTVHRSLGESTSQLMTNVKEQYAQQKVIM